MLISYCPLDLLPSHLLQIGNRLVSNKAGHFLNHCHGHQFVVSKFKLTYEKVYGLVNIFMYSGRCSCVCKGDRHLETCFRSKAPSTTCSQMLALPSHFRMSWQNLKKNMLLLKIKLKISLYLIPCNFKANTSSVMVTPVNFTLCSKGNIFVCAFCSFEVWVLQDTNKGKRESKHEGCVQFID